MEDGEAGRTGPVQLIPRPSECSVCAKTTGRIDYHAEDYGRPLQVRGLRSGSNRQTLFCRLRLCREDDDLRSSGRAWQLGVKVVEDVAGLGNVAVEH